MNDRSALLEAQNAELRATLAQREGEIQALRELNANYQFQLDNRQQEAIWSLLKEIDELNNLRDGLAAELTKLNRVRERTRKKRPHWLQAQHHQNAALGFVLMPYGTSWSNDVYKSIQEVFKRNGCQCDTARLMTGRNIKDDIWKGISSARIIIADLTGNNPNVAYEVGLADHLGKDVILLAQSIDVVFDFRSDRLLLYDLAAFDTLRSDLEKRIQEILNRREEI